MPTDSIAIDLLSRLWEISWQSTVIAGLVLSLRLIFGRALSSWWRHALWLLVLCRLLMPVLPSSRISLFGLGDLFHSIGSKPIAVDPDPPMMHDLPTSAHVSIEYGNSNIKSLPQNERESQPNVPIWRRPVLLMASWLVVSIGLILRLAAINLRFHRTLNRNSKDVDPRLSSLLDDCCRQMRISPTERGNSPQLIVTDLVDAPAVCGVFRPKLLLPTMLASTLSDAQLRLIFLHELAHIQCRDIAIDWLWAVLQSLHWFNPVLWLIAPLRRNDRELARDEMVLSLTGTDQVECYGRTLLELAQPVRLPLFCPAWWACSAVEDICSEESKWSLSSKTIESLPDGSALQC